MLPAVPARCQPIPITKAYIGSDGLAHVERNGRDRAISNELGQVAVEDLKVASDAVGWLVEQNNCCTSYPVATSLVIFAAGRKRVFYERQMIYDWYFLGNGEQVALSIGPTHAGPIPHFLLYDTHSGRTLQEWWGSQSNEPIPLWATGLRE